ncbi:MAG TPA: type I phosphomannose isomerase catalytic subunit [Acidimicrobiia bacterium]|nr:type I phosphomannose isomerase catalytic subunit [Acidimicrobiia bacterium]
MLPDVIRVEPILVERPWGGRRLERFGRAIPEGASAGESWEVADLAASGEGPERCTLVAGGPLAGARLVDIIDAYGAGFLGSAMPAPDGRFPLLVKLLDAREHLSVQVHPPPAVADADPAVRAKNESWYVLDVEPDARIWIDVRTDATDAQLAAVVGTPAMLDLLGELPVRVGDFHHIPAGRVHALGAGLLVLEIQTPSDTTFRMYDWAAEYDRVPRPLHLEESLRSIVRGDAAALSVGASERPGTRRLVTTTDYWIREHRTDDGTVHLDERAELRVVTVVRGSMSLGTEQLHDGDTRILPARSDAIGAVAAEPGSVVVETGLI